MDGSLRVGRYLFAIAMVCFGLEFLVYVSSMSGPLPGPPWSRGVRAFDWLACVGFLVAGVSIATGMWARLASTVLGTVLLLYAAFHYLPTLVARLHDPGPWTVIFEILAMASGAWVLAADAPPDGTIPQTVVSRMAHAGRYLIAVSLIVFAVQHFMYARFVANLVTAWIPAHLFWAYFTGIAFVAAALSIAAGRAVRLSGILLGAMFLLWVFVLHIPRVAHATHNGDEVTSLLVALAMSGIGFALAGKSYSKE
jgi:uncharacterized membrane protein YphA (DoxX/SURF4 family)